MRVIYVTWLLCLALAVTVASGIPTLTQEEYDDLFGTIDDGDPAWLDTIYGPDGEHRYNSFRDIKGNPIGAGYWISRSDFLQTINDGFRMYLHRQDLLLKPKAQLTAYEKDFVKNNNYARPMKVKDQAKLNNMATTYGLTFDQHTQNELLAERLTLLHLPLNMQADNAAHLQQLLREGTATAKDMATLEEAMGKRDPLTRVWTGWPDNAHRIFVLVATPDRPHDPDRQHQGVNCRIHAIHPTVVHPTNPLRLPAPTYIPDHDLPEHELPPRPKGPVTVFPYSQKMHLGSHLMGPHIIPPHRPETHPKRPGPHRKGFFPLPFDLH